MAQGGGRAAQAKYTDPEELSMQAWLRSLVGRLRTADDEKGQGMVEYALILVLIAIVVIGILTLLGGKVSQVFSSINSGLNP